MQNRDRYLNLGRLVKRQREQAEQHEGKPPHSNVRAAVVSAMLRIASGGKPRRAAHNPNAAPATAWTHSVPKP